MGTTSIPNGSALALKRWSQGLYAMAVKQPTQLNSLAGPMPTIDDASGILRKQSTDGMPIVRINDLASSPGDKVEMDCAQVVKLRAIMGDRNAEGQGASLKFSMQEIRIDMATLPVSAGGKMTQKRFQHDLRAIATAQLKGAIPAFLWQRVLVALAGARGEQDGTDWILPLSTDADFANQMINALQAPTYNRHYVVDGTSLVQGGQQLASIDSTDIMRLSHIDNIAALWDEIVIKMMPIKIPGDMGAADDPIKGVLLVDPTVWDGIITDTTVGNNIRTWQAAAIERAKFGQLGAHPLFSPGTLLWNGILVKKMSQGIRFSAGASVNYVSAANRYTATESTATVGAIGAGYQVCRSLLLSAQALGMANGANNDTGVPYSLLENSENFGRNLELAGEIIGGELKTRFSLPNETGQAEPTDFGVLVIDSITARRV